MSGVRQIEGVNILPLDGLWDSIGDVPAEERMRVAMEYAGVTFHDDERSFVSGDAVDLVTLGGVPLAHESDTDEQIAQRLREGVAGSHEVMAASANFSYLSGGNDPETTYKKVVGLGHLSIAHTVSVGLIVAGISEATEVELSLQRDLVHLSKVTNARTKVQDRPSLVVHDAAALPVIQPVYEAAVKAAATMRGLKPNRDERELANTIYPTSKATMLMVTGTLRNLGKLTDFKDDDGKEMEFRDVARRIRGTLGVLWPEIFNGDERVTSDQGSGNAKS